MTGDSNDLFIEDMAAGNDIALFFNDENRSVYIRVNRVHWTLEIELAIARTF